MERLRIFILDLKAKNGKAILTTSCVNTPVSICVRRIANWILYDKERSKFFEFKVKEVIQATKKCNWQKHTSQEQCAAWWWRETLALLHCRNRVEEKPVLE